MDRQLLPLLRFRSLLVINAIFILYKRDTFLISFTFVSIEKRWTGSCYLPANQEKPFPANQEKPFIKVLRLLVINANFYIV